MLGRRGCAVSESSGRHGQEGAPVVANCRAVRRSGPGNPGFPAEAPSLRFGGFEPTGPRATRVSAPDG
ncbi:hypothetical protein SSTG_00604 [Streptomyces sp. e14]|nr:hypothetical protein SSTG_00604 [Streptomyces sp. e14]